MKSLLFPGQGAQYTGMGLDFTGDEQIVLDILNQADEVLGWSLSEVMKSGSEEDLKQTKVTQPAIFVHSIIRFLLSKEQFDKVEIKGCAGHSLGEFTALVASGCLNFEDALMLVSKRAQAMQMACELSKGTMAAILGMDDRAVEEICGIIEGVVVPANYNCPGQLVISGEIKAINLAVEACKRAGAKRALVLNVGGAFHSPLMNPAENELAEAIMELEFLNPDFPIYQNVSGKAEKKPQRIKENLLKQLTAPVKWTQSMQSMIDDGVTEMVEIGGKGNILCGMLRKINREIKSESI